MAHGQLLLAHPTQRHQNFIYVGTRVYIWLLMLERKIRNTVVSHMSL